MTEGRDAEPLLVATYGSVEGDDASVHLGMRSVAILFAILAIGFGVTIFGALGLLNEEAQRKIISAAGVQPVAETSRPAETLPLAGGETMAVDSAATPGDEPDGPLPTVSLVSPGSERPDGPRSEPDKLPSDAVTSTALSSDCSASAVRTDATPTHVVQLGAYRTPDEARAAHLRFSSELSPLFCGRSLVIEVAELGHLGVFHRVRLEPFYSSSEARRFCSEISARGRECLAMGL